jgi:superoxide dismutase, Fe-Mn family
MAFELPPLPYPYEALEPHIDAQTMRIHHDRHHATYVNNLNAALENAPEFYEMSVPDILRNINQVPESIRTAVRNNGGGTENHTMFWEIMSPNGGGEPTGDLAAAINQAFGDFATFKDRFSKAGATRFGSGWTWLIVRDGALEVISTANQDSPYMDGNYPVMGLDVWEHAYYLKYQNKRPDYIAAWWNVVNWPAVAERFAKARG